MPLHYKNVYLLAFLLEACIQPRANVGSERVGGLPVGTLGWPLAMYYSLVCRQTAIISLLLVLGT